MFSKLRNALSGTSTSDVSNKNFPPPGKSCLLPKFPYSRPHFLSLSEDQVQASADHKTRPIITPNQGLSFFAGYAECINAGKSKWNEDQAVSHHGVLKSGNSVMPYNFYALFDGHAGVGASICAANQMHHVLHERLVDTQDEIWTSFRDTSDNQKRNLLIIGALEAAFKDMDEIIKEDRVTLHSSGGCTAIVAIFLLGHLFVANAGDSRAIVCKDFGFEILSTDFTPETDKSRIRQLAQAKPELLGKDFTYMEYIRQPRVNDLGKRILYRDAFMTGWAHKTIAPEDLKIPIISGQGKRSRVMGTIGVTRGFGDHELVSVHQKVPIKPFLSCHPEVMVYNLDGVNHHDVLIMGTDGLWDVVDGHTVTQIINYVTDNFPRKEMCPTAAACLVGAARGSLKENCWMMKSGRLASVDDISVFVIPLEPCSQLMYTPMKYMSTKEEDDRILKEELTDNSSKSDIPIDASSDDYSILLKSHINVPKVSGVTLIQSRKSQIVLQEENEYENEEIEIKLDVPLTTDIDTKDLKIDKNAAVSIRSDQTAMIESHDEEPLIESIALCDDKTIVLHQFSTTASEASSVFYSTEGITERIKSSDESSEDDQRLRACKSKRDFINWMKKKQKEKNIHDIPFRHAVVTSDTQDSENIIDSFSTLTIGAENKIGQIKAQREIITTLEFPVKSHQENRCHSDGYLDSKQSEKLTESHEKKIATKTYIPPENQYIKTEVCSCPEDLKEGQNLHDVKEHTDVLVTPGKQSGDTLPIVSDSPISSNESETLQHISNVPTGDSTYESRGKLTEKSVEEKEICYDQTKRHTDGTDSDKKSPEYKHRSYESPEYKRRLENIKAFESIYKPEHTRIIKTPEFKQRVVKTPSPQPMHKTKHTKSLRSPEYKRRTADPQSPKFGHKTVRDRVSHSFDYPQWYESPTQSGGMRAAQQIAPHELTVTSERMKQLQMIQNLLSQPEPAGGIMPIRSISPSAPVDTAFRERTNSYPSSEIVKPSSTTITREQQQQGACKKQYSYAAPHKTNVSTSCKELVAKTHSEQMPSKITAAEHHVRAPKVLVKFTKTVQKSKTRQSPPKQKVKETKLEFHSDHDEED